jgi:deoxyuridine 5'-triphosphate nucleotidohydrolase
MIHIKFVQLTDEDSYKGYYPRQMTEGSACYDLYVPREVQIHPGQVKAIPLLIAFDIPEPYYIEVFPRSSLQTKQGIISSTSIIDTDYKKGIHAIVYNSTSMKQILNKGQRIMQFLVRKKEDLELHLVSKIEDTGRGGLGSTDGQQR